MADDTPSSDIFSVLKLLQKRLEKEAYRADELDQYMRPEGKRKGPYIPRDANREYRQLADRADANLVPLVIDAQAQDLYVEGYRDSQQRTDDDPDVWTYGWQRNGLDARQGAVHRAALSYGISYVTVLPGDARGPVIRGASPRRAIALYDEPAEDEWPVYGLKASPQRDSSGNWYRLRLFDDVNVYEFKARDSITGNPTYIGVGEHGAGVCPFVRFYNTMDLDGRCTGEVEQLMKMQDRTDQTVFDLLMAQTFASFVVRMITGMTLPEDDDEAAKKKFKLAMDRFLIAEDPEAKAQSFQGTPLDGFISASDHSFRTMAIRAQVAPHQLLGDMTNLSADAIAEARSGSTRKGEERRHGLGESWEQTLRLAAQLHGDEKTLDDVGGQVMWRDIENRSLAAVTDALGKLAQMLGVPQEALWAKVPGVSQGDLESWREAKAAERASDPLARMNVLLGPDGQPINPAA